MVVVVMMMMGRRRASEGQDAEGEGGGDDAFHCKSPCRKPADSPDSRTGLSA
jgi:hypothetical protein